MFGTKGKRCDLVHGDHWNEIKGNHVENIAQDQTLKVVGKHKETLVESCYQNIIGPHIVLNNNVRNETRLNTFTLVYGGAQNQQSSDGESWIKPFDAAWVDYFAFEYDTTKLEIMGAHGEAVAVHGEAVLCHAEYKLFHTEINTIHNSVDVAGNQVTAAANDAKALENKLAAINSTIHDVGVIASMAFVDAALLKNHSGMEMHEGAAVFSAITGTGLIAP